MNYLNQEVFEEELKNERRERLLSLSSNSSHLRPPTVMSAPGVQVGPSLWVEL